LEALMGAKAKAQASGEDAVRGAGGGDPGTSLYLVHGEDELKVTACAKRLIDQLCPPAEQALNLEIVDAMADRIEPAVEAVRQCLGAVLTVGLFGGRKVVWLRNATFFNEGEPGRFDDVKAAVAQLTEEIKKGLPEDHVLVVTAGKVDGRSAFFKACKAAGKVEEFAISEKPYEAAAQATEFAGHAFAEAGLQIDPQTLGRFLDRCGNQSRQIAQEVEKLRLYLGKGKSVSEADVRLMVAPTREGIAWDLADAFGRRDLVDALRTLRLLLFQRAKDHVLLLGLISRIRELMVFRACLDQRWIRVTGEGRWAKAEWQGPADAAAPLEAVLGRAPASLHWYRLKTMAEQAQRFESAELSRCHHLALETYERMISGAAGGDVLLELFLIRALGGTRHAA
jgi:DNA polymerase-3 subunit delta